MKKLIQVTFLIWTFCTSVWAQDWKVYVNTYGQYNAQVSAISKTPDGPITAILNLRCKTKNFVVFSYVIQRISKVKFFDFNDFEGPDAKANGKRLVSIKMQTKKGAIYIKTAVSGSRGFYPETDAFQFGIAGGNPKAKNNISRILNGILKEGTSMISITVQSYNHRKKTFYTEFSTSNASNSVTQMLKGCGEP
jgi:hypothetical protein